MENVKKGRDAFSVLAYSKDSPNLLRQDRSPLRVEQFKHTHLNRSAHSLDDSSIEIKIVVRDVLPTHALTHAH
jgi:hypothetical protein